MTSGSEDMGSSCPSLDNTPLDLYYALIFCFAVTLCFAMLQLLRTFWKEGFSKWTISKIVLLIAPLPIITRIVDMTTFPVPKNYLCQPLDSQYPSNLIPGSLPNYIFFSECILLVLYWAVLFHAKDGDMILKHRFRRNVKLTYIFVNVAVYIIWAVLIAEMLKNQNNKDVFLKYHYTEAVFSSVINLISSTGFLIYGTIIYRALIKVAFVEFMRSKASLPNKILTLTVCCAIIFSCRSLVILLMIFIDSPLTTFALKLVYPLFFEMVPTLLIAFTLGLPFLCFEGYETKSPKRQRLIANEGGVSDLE